MPVQNSSRLSDALIQNLRAGCYHLENPTLLGERKIKIDGLDNEYNMSTLFTELVKDTPSKENCEKLKLFKQIDNETSNFLVDIYYKIFGGRRKEVDLVKQHALENLDENIKILNEKKSSCDAKIMEINYEIKSLTEKRVIALSSNKGDLREITEQIRKLEKQLDELKATSKACVNQAFDLKDLAIKYKTIE